MDIKRCATTISAVVAIGLTIEVTEECMEKQPITGILNFYLLTNNFLSGWAEINGRHKTFEVFNIEVL